MALGLDAGATAMRSHLSPDYGPGGAGGVRLSVSLVHGLRNRLLFVQHKQPTTV